MKRTLGILLVAAMLLTLLPAAALAEASISGTIKFWYCADESNPNDHSAVWHKDNIAQFEAMYPGVKVEPTIVVDGNEYLTKVSTEIAAGNTPDVFRTWLTGRLEPFVTAGRVMALNDLVAKTPALQEVLSDDALSLATFDGKYYAFPLLRSGEIVFYNKKIFADNNVQVPTNFTEFLAAVKTFKDAGILPVAMGNKDIWPGCIPYMMIFDRVNGTQLYQDVVLGKQAKFTDQGFLDAAAKLQELMAAGTFDANCNAISYSDATNAFAQGKAAMIFDGSWNIPLYSQGLGENAGFFNFPAIEGGKGDANNYLMNFDDAYGIGATTQNQAAAEAFLTFMFSKDRQKVFAEYGNLIACKNIDVDTSKVLPLVTEVGKAFQGASYFEIPWDNPLGTNIGTEVNTTVQAILAGQDAKAAFEKLNQVAQQEWE